MYQLFNKDIKLMLKLGNRLKYFFEKVRHIFASSTPQKFAQISIQIKTMIGQVRSFYYCLSFNIFFNLKKN